MQRKLKLVCLIMFGVISWLFYMDFPPGYAEIQDVVDTRETDQIVIFRGDVVTLKVFSLTRVAITEPGIFEIGKLEADEMLLIGQQEGETILFIWDEYGKRKIRVKVITQDLDMTIKRLEALFESAGIRGLKLEKSGLEDKIIISGKNAKDKQEKYEEIKGQFLADIIDMTVEDVKLVRLDVQVTELTQTLTKTLGIGWTSGGTGLGFTYPETMPVKKGDFGDLFRIGDFSRTNAITAAVNMLLTEGKARVLSKPSVIVSDGSPTNFTVGGEIPVRTSTASEGSVSENVSYKSYGVTISVTPEIKGDKIDVDLNVSVSDIDASNAVGLDVAFVSRSATTKLLLNQGQTIILAGLIKSNKGESLARVPFLSKIPIVGLLFRTKNWTPNSEQEIVISLTPTILEDLKDKKGQEGKGAKEVSAQEKEAQGEVKEQPLETEPSLETGGPIKQEQLESQKSQPSEIEAKIDSIIEEEAGDKENQQPTELSSEGETPIAQPSEQKSQPAEIETPTNAALEKGREPVALSDSMPFDEELKSEESEENPAEAGKDIKGTTERGIEEEFVFKEEDISQALTRYVQQVQQKISQAITFPYKAKENNWQGTVKLALVILSDGTLNDIVVEESSGHEIFDEDALNTAQLVAPFDPFPAEISLEEIKITLPIVYSQEAVLQEAK